MTKIVITDADTMTRGDLDLHVLEKYGELTIYPTTHGEEECVKHIGDADVVFLNKTEITASILQRVNHVKYIGLFATGYNVIDLDACKERGICAVSYTHLDVYKRQHNDRSRNHKQFGAES